MQRLRQFLQKYCKSVLLACVEVLLLQGGYRGPGRVPELPPAQAVHHRRQQAQRPQQRLHVRLLQEQAHRAVRHPDRAVLAGAGRVCAGARAGCAHPTASCSLCCMAWPPLPLTACLQALTNCLTAATAAHALCVKSICTMVCHLPVARTCVPIAAQHWYCDDCHAQHVGLT